MWSTTLYSGIRELVDITSSGSSTKIIYANQQRLAEKTGSTVEYVHVDHLGSTRLRTANNPVTVTYSKNWKPLVGV